jgi:hypothetical protein
MASMSYRELVTLLRKNGIEFVRSAKGDHEIWFSPITRRKLTVPTEPEGRRYAAMHSSRQRIERRAR